MAVEGTAFTGEDFLVKGEVFADVVGSDCRLRIVDWREAVDGMGPNFVRIEAWIEKNTEVHNGR